MQEAQKVLVVDDDGLASLQKAIELELVGY